MRPHYTRQFLRSYAKAPRNIQLALERKLELLLKNLRHPSLRAKKYDNIRWQARINGGWRFYFRIKGDAYILLDMIPHPK